MRTTISIPDPTYEAAGQLARRLGISRSELISRAVAAFVQAAYELLPRDASTDLSIAQREFVVETHPAAAGCATHNEEITAQLNRVYAEVDSALDQELMQLQVVSARCGFSDSW